MLRWIVIPAAVAVVAVAAGGTAAADPPTPGPGTPCASNLAGAMTWLADAKAPLSCDGDRWSPVADPYPVSDEWVSLGPKVTLHGQGRRNPSIMTGAWTATPLDDETTCRATQYAVIPNTPQVGEPTVAQAPAGKALALEVVPSLFTIELTGDCLWQKSP